MMMVNSDAGEMALAIYKLKRQLHHQRTTARSYCNTITSQLHQVKQAIRNNTDSQHPTIESMKQTCRRMQEQAHDMRELLSPSIQQRMELLSSPFPLQEDKREQATTQQTHHIVQNHRKTDTTTLDSYFTPCPNFTISQQSHSITFIGPDYAPASLIGNLSPPFTVQIIRMQSKNHIHIGLTSASHTYTYTGDGFVLLDSKKVESRQSSGFIRGDVIRVQVDRGQGMIRWMRKRSLCQQWKQLATHSLDVSRQWRPYVNMSRTGDQLKLMPEQN